MPTAAFPPLSRRAQWALPPCVSATSVGAVELSECQAPVLFRESSYGEELRVRTAVASVAAEAAVAEAVLRSIDAEVGRAFYRPVPAQARREALRTAATSLRDLVQPGRASGFRAGLPLADQLSAERVLTAAEAECSETLVRVGEARAESATLLARHVGSELPPAQGDLHPGLPPPQTPGGPEASLANRSDARALEASREHLQFGNPRPRRSHHPRCLGRGLAG